MPTEYVLLKVLDITEAGAGAGASASARAGAGQCAGRVYSAVQGEDAPEVSNPGRGDRAADGLAALSETVVDVDARCVPRTIDARAVAAGISESLLVLARKYDCPAR